MKLIKQSLLLTLVCLVLFAFLYPTVIWGFARVAGPNGGKGEIIEKNGRIIGFANVGQSFTQDNYFNGRPSAVGYNAAGSGGSNKAPSNPDYLKEVQARIDTFLVHNPDIAKNQIPAELVTASGSGLDPHISPQAAYVQILRIAKARNLRPENVQDLVNSQTDEPFLGFLGPATINVLKLNLALDEMSQ